jgi:hypothetical protein
MRRRDFLLASSAAVLASGVAATSMETSAPKELDAASPSSSHKAARPGFADTAELRLAAGDARTALGISKLPRHDGEGERPWPGPPPYRDRYLWQVTSA